MRERVFDDVLVREAQVLLDEVTYPIMMHQVIDDRSRGNDPLVNNLFVTHKELKAAAAAAQVSSPVVVTESAGAPSNGSDLQIGAIKVLKEGYGFIRPDGGGQNIFFFHAEVTNSDFNDLVVGDKVGYALGSNDKGPCAIQATKQ
jgi:cold shock CspA family protein